MSVTDDALDSTTAERTGTSPARRAVRRFSGDYRSHSPFRTPAWRWECAQQHLQRGDRLRRWEDPSIKTAVQFLRAEARVATARGRAMVLRRWPELVAARELYQNGGVQRDELEARLLAGESIAVAAEKLNIAPSVAALYVTFFFDVVDHLYLTRASN